MPPQDLTRFKEAVLHRLIDRPKCDWPEIAVIGEPADTVPLATKFRREGVATQTYLAPVRRQVAKAKKDDADYLVFADTLAMRCCVTGVQWYLDKADPATGALFGVNCGYLPFDWSALDA